MPSLLLLATTLAVNYWRHTHNQSTICSTVRANLPEPITETAVTAVFAWLILHLHRGYRRNIAIIKQEAA